MSWIRIDEDTYALEASPDPQEVVSIKALEAEIASLETEKSSLEKTLMSKDGVPGFAIAAIDKWNEPIQMEIDQLGCDINEKQEKLTEIQSG